ncbi:hypothetical protein B5X24_HaOG209203 [Helicoverpa armigera]|nr:hypothetical protein B5X24_HaOG209203 [Helicoverpa armigera]
MYRKPINQPHKPANHIIPHNPKDPGAGRLDPRGVADGTPGEGAVDRHGLEERAHDVAHAQCYYLLGSIHCLSFG